MWRILCDDYLPWMRSDGELEENEKKTIGKRETKNNGINLAEDEEEGKKLE